MTADNGLVAHMHVLSEVASFDLLMEPGRPRSWNTVLPGNTLEPSGHHAVLCHAEGRNQRPGDWDAARNLATNFIEGYRYDGNARRPPLREAADHALKELDVRNESATPREQGHAHLIAAAITSRGIDWLRIGDGTLLVAQPDSPVNALIEPRRNVQKTDPDAAPAAADDVLMTDTFTARNSPEPIEKGTVLISASSGIQCLTLEEVRTVVHQHQNDPRVLAMSLQQAVQARNPELKLRTPSITVCVLQDPRR